MKLSMSFIMAGLGFVLAGTSQAETSLETLKPLLIDNCSACHNESLKRGGLDVNDDKQVLSSLDLIIQVIEVGTMPMGKPEFKDSEDGIELVEGLKELKTDLEDQL